MSNISDESTYSTSWYHRYSTSRYTEAAALATENRTGDLNKDSLISKRDSFLTSGVSDRSGRGPDLWTGGDDDDGGVFHCLQWTLDD